MSTRKAKTKVVRRTAREWQQVKAPKPPPTPTYTEAEYEALKAENQEPFYQLKREFPGITYDGTFYWIEGRRFAKSIGEGFDTKTGYTIAVLAPATDDGMPLCTLFMLTCAADWPGFLAWEERQKAEETSKPRRSWLDRLLR